MDERTITRRAEPDNLPSVSRMSVFFPSLDSQKTPQFGGLLLGHRSEQGTADPEETGATVHCPK